jgi:hypothetical protein
MHNLILFRTAYTHKRPQNKTKNTNENKKKHNLAKLLRTHNNTMLHIQGNTEVEVM